MDVRRIAERERAAERSTERERINESLQTKNSILNPQCRAG